MIYGVVRSDGRGVPKCIAQKEMTRREDKIRARGTLKVAHLKGDSTIDGLLAISYYDSKPFYMMSNATNCIEWIQKKRKVWRKDQQMNVSMTYHRLNVIDEYNYNMNNVDIADQLRGSYRFDHWMRKRKWWWSMFFWCYQMLLTNCFIVYKKYMIMHRQKPMTHYEFQKAIALAWIDSKHYWPNLNKKRKLPLEFDLISKSSSLSKSLSTKHDMATTRRSLRMHTEASKQRMKSIRVTDESLAPDGALRIRLQRGEHWPVMNEEKKEPRCQLHYWATDLKHRAQLMFCQTCEVTLCLQCFKLFHTVEDLVGQKLQIRQQYLCNKLCHKLKNEVKKHT